ncbi:MAG: hypothetical protein OSJ43_12290 [Oscillospiraceae bacterium]|nr:hypothetical protein [Oscillospiraceae bacterium]
MKSEVSILAPVGVRKSESIITNSARSAGAAKFKHEKKRKKIAKVSRKKNRG